MEDPVGGDAEGILDVEELAELIEQGQSEAGIAAQLDLHAGKRGLQTRHQAQQHGHDTGMAGGRTRPQARRQQTAGVALEDQHGMIHVLAVGAVEEAELLLAVSGIVGGIDVEQNLAALTDLVAAEPDELLTPDVVEAHQIAGGGRVLPTAEGGLGAERVSQFLIGDDLQERIVAQAVGVVGIFIASDDLVEALPQKRQGIMMNAVVLPRIAEQLGPVASQMMTLIESSQGQKTGVAGDLAAGKIGADGLMTMEGERELW